MLKSGSDLELYPMWEAKGALRIFVSYTLFIARLWASFLLRNTHSVPEVSQPLQPDVSFVPERYLETSWSGDKLDIGYYYYPAYNAPRILTNKLSDRAVQPNYAVAGHPWHAPFFYEDARHAFYVTTKKEVNWASAWGNFGLPEASSSPELALDIPPVSGGPLANGQGAAGAMIGRPGGNGSPSIDGFVTEDAHIGRVIGASGTVPYGDAEIGLTGKTPATPTE